MTNVQYLSGGGANSVAPNIPPQYLQQPQRMTHVSVSTVYTAYRELSDHILFWSLCLAKIVNHHENLLTNCPKIVTIILILKTIKILGGFGA